MFLNTISGAGRRPFDGAAAEQSAAVGERSWRPEGYAAANTIRVNLFVRRAGIVMIRDNCLASQNGDSAEAFPGDRDNGQFAGSVSKVLEYHGGSAIRAAALP